MISSWIVRRVPSHELSITSFIFLCVLEAEYGFIAVQGKNKAIFCF
jgi:hypothetical protein